MDAAISSSNTSLSAFGTIDVIDRVPGLQGAGAHAKEKFRNQQIECRNYAHEHGIDKPEIPAWRWPA